MFRVMGICKNLDGNLVGFALLNMYNFKYEVFNPYMTFELLNERGSINTYFSNGNLCFSDMPDDKVPMLSAEGDYLRGGLMTSVIKVFKDKGKVIGYLLEGAISSIMYGGGKEYLSLEDLQKEPNLSLANAKVVKRGDLHYLVKLKDTLFTGQITSYERLRFTKPSYFTRDGDKSLTRYYNPTYVRSDCLTEASDVMCRLEYQNINYTFLSEITIKAQELNLNFTAIYTPEGVVAASENKGVTNFDLLDEDNKVGVKAVILENGVPSIKTGLVLKTFRGLLFFKVKEPFSSKYVKHPITRNFLNNFIKLEG
jgi:hypothetical protein